jgi:hypothetical protein
MAAGDVLGDRQAEADAGSDVLVARLVEPGEGEQYLLAFVLRDPRAVILDREFQRTLGQPDR